MKGPGTAIKEMFSLMLIDSKPDCLCHQRATYLDILGYRWAMDNLETVVDWFEDEAKNRGLAFDRDIAKRLAVVAMKRGVDRNAKLRTSQQGHGKDRRWGINLLWQHGRRAAMSFVGAAIGILCSSPIVRRILEWNRRCWRREEADQGG